MDRPDEVDGWPIMTPAQELPKPVEDRRSWPGLGRLWLIVFALNLPVCLWFGCMVTSGSGKLGMLAGLIGLFAIGWTPIRRARPFGIDLLVGGTVVLFSQFAPIAQIWAGMAGLHVAEKIVRLVGIDLDRSASGVSLLQASFATLLTGGILMGVAMVLGLISRLITPGHWRWPGPRRPKTMALSDLRDF